jgi:hypothetical protein
LDGSHPDLKTPWSYLFPTKFLEVTKGSKIEAFGYMENGEFVLGGLDVTKDKAEEKDKEDDKRKEK